MGTKSARTARNVDREGKGVWLQRHAEAQRGKDFFAKLEFGFF